MKISAEILLIKIFKDDNFKNDKIAVICKDYLEIINKFSIFNIYSIKRRIC